MASEIADDSGCGPAGIVSLQKPYDFPVLTVAQLDFWQLCHVFMVATLCFPPLCHAKAPVSVAQPAFWQLCHVFMVATLCFPPLCHAKAPVSVAQLDFWQLCHAFLVATLYFLSLCHGSHHFRAPSTSSGDAPDERRRGPPRGQRLRRSPAYVKRINDPGNIPRVFTCAWQIVVFLILILPARCHRSFFYRIVR